VPSVEERLIASIEKELERSMSELVGTATVEGSEIGTTTEHA
jgi:Fe-S cluster assembly protein SufD